MHQSFATTSPSGPGNSGDIDFSLTKARVYAQHCRDTLMVKALPKSPLKSRQVNVNFHGHFGTGIKTPAIPRHCGDNAEVKTLQLSPAMPPLFPAPRGPWLQMTGALEDLRIDSVQVYHTGKCKSTGASCNALVQIKLRTGVRLKWRKR